VNKIKILLIVFLYLYLSLLYHTLLLLLLLLFCIFQNLIFLYYFLTVADIVMWTTKGSRYIVIVNNVVDIYSSEVLMKF